MIRGKKNYLQQTQLVMGFSFFFRLDEESIANHVNDRRVKYVELENDHQVDDSNQNEDEQEEPSAFPDTKIRTVSKSEHDQNMILEAMKPRPKVQKKLKMAKQDKKIEQQNDKQLNKQQQQQSKQTNQKNKKTKGKRNKKDDDWSDDEDKITIKLNKKLQKDNRLQDIEDQVRTVSLNDEDAEDEEIELNDEINDNEISAQQLNEQSNEQSNQQSNEQSNQQTTDNETEILEPQQPNAESSDSGEDEKIEYDEEEDEVEETETNDERREAEYLKLVNSLTGQPLSNDVLMYCVPVVAPYNALANCKFKVKILPGTNKRGRAGKTALQLFLHEKRLTPRERDLLKSMKDQEIARNLPPKVKVTAQHLQQVKRKK